METKFIANTENELLERCQTLSGKTIKEIAYLANYKIPKTLVQAKGFIGQLIEWYLGVSDQNCPKPDFAHLGIELKTIPVNEKGNPQESTYVCTAPITLSSTVETWETSRVRAKLNKVLWVPIESNPTISIENRKIGNPILWQCPSTLELILKNDWEELTDMLLMGHADKISARFGTYLHIRPKAKNSKILHSVLNEEGENVLTVPKGFYLRNSFTEMILQENYLNV